MKYPFKLAVVLLLSLSTAATFASERPGVASAFGATAEDVAINAETLAQILNGAHPTSLAERFNLTNPIDISLAEALTESSGWSVTELEVRQSVLHADLNTIVSRYRLRIVIPAGGSDRRLDLVKIGDFRWRDYTSWDDLERATDDNGIDWISVAAFDSRNCDLFAPHIGRAELPLASVSKVIVSAVALREKVDLSDTVTLDRRGRSLPSGSWHELPHGAERLVSETVVQSLMASDNTATDMLISYLGRARVTEIAGRDFGYRNDLPFFLTSELFRLKWSPSASDLRERFLRSRTLASRFEVLRELAAADTPLPSLTGNEPVTDPLTLEWIATPTGVCRAINEVADSAIWPRVSAGLRLDASGTSGLERAWYVKRGREPGVWSIVALSSSGTQRNVVVVAVGNMAGDINTGHAEHVFANALRLIEEKLDA